MAQTKKSHPSLSLSLHMPHLARATPVAVDVHEEATQSARLKSYGQNPEPQEEGGGPVLPMQPTDESGVLLHFPVPPVTRLSLGCAKPKPKPNGRGLTTPTDTGQNPREGPGHRPRPLGEGERGCQVSVRSLGSIKLLVPKTPGRATERLKVELCAAARASVDRRLSLTCSGSDSFSCPSPSRQIVTVLVVLPHLEPALVPATVTVTATWIFGTVHEQ